MPKLDFWHYGDKAGWWEPLQHESRSVEPVEPLAEQLRHFCAVIRGSEAPLTGAADAARTLAVVEAVAEAARTGAPVKHAPLRVLSGTGAA